MRDIILAFVLVTAVRGVQAQNLSDVNPRLPNNRSTKVHSVFVNLSGDDGISRRLWAYLQYELEDQGVKLVNAENKADAVLTVVVDRKPSKKEVVIGVSQIEFIDGSGASSATLCHTISTDKKATFELFNTAGESLAKRIRDKYPKAKSIKLEPNSDTRVAPRFAEEFNSELKKDGIALTNNSDVRITLRLIPTTVKLQEEELEYRYELLTRGEITRASGHGTDGLSVVPINPPADCPERFSDMAWAVKGNRAVFDLAQRIAETITKPIKLPEF